MSLLIGLPAYNEEPVIHDVVKRLKNRGYDNVLVVDDCSVDDTKEEAEKAGAKVIQHDENKGAGGATKTILNHARQEGYDHLVLMDSDGQHDPRDIKKLEDYKDEYDFVLGVRDLSNPEVPIRRKIANRFGNFITWLYFGNWVSDSQSGFKLLNKKAIQKVTITFDGYEFCSELLGEVKKHDLRLKEVPIRVIYTDHSQQKGQSIMKGFKMLWRFTKHKFR